jgi:hypothetical protein
MLDRKGNTHEGGIRVPFFVRWPGRLQPGRTVDRIAAHIDVAPTLLDLCGANRPAQVRFDGVSLRPLLQGNAAGWSDRTLYFQWHRGDAPQLNRACAALSPRYKLVQPLGSADGRMPENPVFELYDYAADPLEMKNIAASHPDVVTQMRRGYEAWFKDVTGGRDYAVPPRIAVGAVEQKEVLFTRQDWRGSTAGWTPDSVGHWFVDVRRAGDYAITLRFAKTQSAGVAKVTIGSAKAQQNVAPGDSTVTLGNVRLEQGPATVGAVLETNGKTLGMTYVEVKAAF